MDGAQTNRDFVKMFVDVSPSEYKFSTTNIWAPAEPDITFIMDYSHVIKRVRNNISKSSDIAGSVRQLFFHQPILWQYWINAFRWDRVTNAFPIHRKLSEEHLYLTIESRVRNKLDEEVPNSDMLVLMESFQKSLNDQGSVLNDTISLLKRTSVIISNFRDNRPKAGPNDIRLDQLEEALSWFQEWEKTVKSMESLSASVREKRLMSQQTRDDLHSCIVGFTLVSKTYVQTSKHSLIPSRLNSDVIENILCQQRGIINGANTSPTFYQYCQNINTVIIGQNTVSKISNAENKGAGPLCFNVKMPVKHKKNGNLFQPLISD